MAIEHASSELVPSIGLGSGGDWAEALVEGLSGLGLVLDEGTRQVFGRYLTFLREENERVNLTSIVEPVEVALKHFVDSATVLGAVEVPPGELVVDVGSGAGFPGVPLSLLRPDLQVTLVEANQKKAAFLSRLRDHLSLENLEVVVGRAEELGRKPGHRERYGLAAARAVAPLGVVWEYLLPLVGPGGWSVALKGPGVAEELEQGQRAARVLGGGDQVVSSFLLPQGAGDRRVVVVRKTGRTPGQYPRRTGIPAKKPL